MTRSATPPRATRAPRDRTHLLRLGRTYPGCQPPTEGGDSTLGAVMLEPETGSSAPRGYCDVDRHVERPKAQHLLLIVGAAKAETTALHPVVVASDPKELNYFVRAEKATADEYHGLLQPRAGACLLVDASPYIYVPAVRRQQDVELQLPTKWHLQLSSQPRFLYCDRGP